MTHEDSSIGVLHSSGSVIEAAGNRLDARKITLLLVASLTIMAGATISPSLPGIEAEFAGAEHIEVLSRLVLTIPALFVAICAPALGPLSDRMGRRKLLIGSTVLYGVSGISGLVLDSIIGLLTARALLGVAVAGLMTLGTALVADYFSGPARERYVGLQQACVGIGGLVFFSAGGGLAELHWRAPFMLYGLAFLLVPAVIVHIRDVAPPREAPMLSMGSNGMRTDVLSIAALCLTALINSAVFYLIPAELPFHMRALDLASPNQSGWVMGLVPFVMALSSLGYGRLNRSAGLHALFTLGFAVMAAGFWMIAAASSLAMLAAGTSTVGFGLGFVMPTLMSAAMTLAAPATRGAIAGLLTASIFIGQFISPFAGHALIEQSGRQQAFRCGALLLLVVAASSWLQRRRFDR